MVVEKRPAGADLLEDEPTFHEWELEENIDDAYEAGRIGAWGACRAHRREVPGYKGQKGADVLTLRQRPLPWDLSHVSAGICRREAKSLW